MRNRGIPRVRSWRVRVMDGETELERLVVQTITRRLAIMITRQDYPRTWGHSLLVSPIKEG